jgi:hypothetical protein
VRLSWAETGASCCQGELHPPPRQGPLDLLLLYLQNAGLAHFVAVISSPLSTLRGSSGTDCNVPGFTFRPNVVPSPNESWPNNAPIQFYTLPHTPRDGIDGVTKIVPTPRNNLPVTVAACEADAACAMFTSDCYIIAAYHHTDPFKRISSEADIT